MPSILSHYFPPDTPELFREFETACADEIRALYQRFRAEKALARLREIHPEALATPVEQLGLPSRAVTALKRKGIDTVQDLLPFSEESLSMVRGISTESAAEMMASIRSLLE